MRRKSSLMILLAVFMIFAFVVTGCSNGTPQEEPNQEGTASDFPSKPVTLIVPYGAGGGTDVTARLLAEPLEKALGQPVVVQNIEGGGGWNGWGQLANAPKDGYTLGYVNIPNVFAGYLDPAMNRKENIDSFIMLLNHVTDPGIFAVKADSKYNSMQDVIDDAKANPGKVSITAHGVGGDDYLGIKQIEKTTGVEFNIIHNNSTAESKTQVLGGHVDVLGANVSEITGMVANGEIKVLGVAYDKRSEFLPDVPTLQEQGIDAVHFAARGMAVPAGTPDEIVEKLTSALEEAIANPDYLSKYEELGLSLEPKKGQEYTDFIKTWESKIKELMGW
ncbi:MAG: tripartite tricarboxylate transporter substrate binding protein [Dehalobacterium sp.]